MISRCNSVLAGLAVAVAASAASAGAVDVYLTIEDGQVRTGAIDKLNGFVVTPDVRVFEAELGEEGPGAGDDPGFFTETFTAGTSIGFEIRDGLQEWDGSTFNYSALTMDLSKGPLSATTPAGAGIVPGFNFATADATGFFDDHPEFELSDGLVSGVFLLTLSVTTDAPGVAASDDIYIVFGNDVSESLIEAAEEYVETVIIPAPGAAVLAAGALAFGVRRRR